MIDLYEELKNHVMSSIHFEQDSYKVVLVDGVTIIATTPQKLTDALKALRG